MTVPGRPPGAAPGDPDAERVLAQALRAMAGGSRQSRPAYAVDEPGSADGRQDAGHLRLDGLQIMLVAVLVGLLIGVTVGLVSLIA